METNRDVQVRVAWEPGVETSRGAEGDQCPLTMNGSAAHCVGGAEVWHAAGDVLHCPFVEQKIWAF